MKEKDFKEKIRIALFISDAVEKIFIFFKLINDASEGLEELEKEFKHERKNIKRMVKNTKFYR